MGWFSSIINIIHLVLQSAIIINLKNGFVGAELDLMLGTEGNSEFQEIHKMMDVVGDDDTVISRDCQRPQKSRGRTQVEKYRPEAGLRLKNINLRPDSG